MSVFKTRKPPLDQSEYPHNDPLNYTVLGCRFMGRTTPGTTGAYLICSRSGRHKGDKSVLATIKCTKNHIQSNEDYYVSGDNRMSPDIAEDAKNKAETRGIDVFDIRTPSTEGEGETVRVLAGGETEDDCYKVQATKPPGPMGDTMFSRNLTEKLNALQNRLNGSSETEREVVEEEELDVQSKEAQEHDVTPVKKTIEETQSDEDEDQSESGTQELSTGRAEVTDTPTTDPRQSGTSVGSLTVEVGIDGELDQVIEQISDEVDAVTDELDEIEDTHERLDDFEERLERIESTLSLLGSVGDDGAQD